MNSDNILAHINSIVQLNEEETEYLKSVLISRPFRQGEYIVKSGDTAAFLMYVNSGYVMTYYTDTEGSVRVIQVATKGGWWAGDLYSLTDEPTTDYSTKGLCEGEVLLLPRLAQHQLLAAYPKFEKYFRIIFQESLIRQQKRFLEVFTMPAEERYRQYTLRFPNMEQHVPQKYIASYLGITPQFLSKIRKRVVKRS